MVVVQHRMRSRVFHRFMPTPHRERKITHFHHNL
jgi:hypothetical protein